MIEKPTPDLKSDPETTLSWKDQRAVVASLGASLRRYFRASADGTEKDIVWGYQGLENKKGGQGDVLIPFPGRIKSGRYAFGDRTHQLECNDKEGPNAIHGFLRKTVWEKADRISVGATENQICFVTQMEEGAYAAHGYPFSLGVEVTYRLTDAGLECEFSITNTGVHPAPVGAGFHPYFVVGGSQSVNDFELQFLALHRLEFDSNLAPTGVVLPIRGSEYDFSQSKAIGSTRINDCFLGLRADSDGVKRIRLSDRLSGERVTVWMDPSFSYLVLYTGDAIEAPYTRQALAIEPMTCGSDGFNHPEWGLVSLMPGKVLRGRWGVSQDFIESKSGKV